MNNSITLQDIKDGNVVGVKYKIPANPKWSDLIRFSLSKGNSNFNISMKDYRSKIDGVINEKKLTEEIGVYMDIIQSTKSRVQQEMDVKENIEKDGLPIKKGKIVGLNITTNDRGNLRFSIHIRVLDKFKHFSVAINNLDTFKEDYYKAVDKWILEFGISDDFKQEAYNLLDIYRDKYLKIQEKNIEKLKNSRN